MPGLKIVVQILRILQPLEGSLSLPHHPCRAATVHIVSRRICGLSLWCFSLEILNVWNSLRTLARAVFICASGLADILMICDTTLRMVCVIVRCMRLKGIHVSYFV